MMGFLFEIVDLNGIKVDEVKVFGERSKNFATKSAKSKLICRFPDTHNIYKLEYKGRKNIPTRY